jgi:hypothetical protein
MLRGTKRGRDLLGCTATVGRTSAGSGAREQGARQRPTGNRTTRLYHASPLSHQRDWPVLEAWRAMEFASQLREDPAIASSAFIPAFTHNLTQQVPVDRRYGDCRMTV